MAATRAYPVHVDASLDAPLSRWLWIFKWVLVIPHVVALAFLWMAFVVMSVVAFVAILFTGNYPRSVFEFNVGVLRWTWRVGYYALAAFGTDKYPPFTFADVPDYPAHLEVEYPRHLSRGLVLVKWWLLAIPHYIVVGVFTGTGAWYAWRLGNENLSFGIPGLIGVLVLIAAVVLLFTGRYPRQIFDFVLGMNRWVLRVAAYAGLMTDQYPPFRLDMGGHEPGSTLTLPQPPPGQGFGAGAGAPQQWQPHVGGAPEGGAPEGGAPEGAPAGGAPGAGRHTGGRPATGWTAPRVISVVIGAMIVLFSLGLLGGGGTALWAQTQRHGGYVSLGTETFTSSGYALASDTVELHATAGSWDAAKALFGNVRIRVTSAGAVTPVFVGIATADAADRYLSGVQYTTVLAANDRYGRYIQHSGAAPLVPPARAGLWTASATGPGTQTLVWQPHTGLWTVVAMNADGSRPVTMRANIAAELPALPWVATGLLIAGFVFLALGALLIVVPVRHASS